MTAAFSCSNFEDYKAYDDQSYVQESVDKNENKEIPHYYNSIDSGESYWFGDTYKNLPVVTDTFEPVYIEE